MRFDWDATKEATNLAKHHIDFVFAAGIFAGRVITAEDRRADYGETRFVSLGQTAGLVLVVVWTLRDPDTYRLISARRANAKERKIYGA